MSPTQPGKVMPEGSHDSTSLCSPQERCKLAKLIPALSTFLSKPLEACHTSRVFEVVSCRPRPPIDPDSYS